MIFTKEQERIFDFVEKQTGHGIIDAVAGAGKTTTIMECARFVEDCDTLNDILKRIKDFITATDNPIKLSTIHRAKGLENKRVFILNYDELPYYRTQQKEWEKTQELNLKYVAITRTLQELYLVESKSIEIIEDGESLFDNLPFDFKNEYSSH